MRQSKWTNYLIFTGVIVLISSIILSLFTSHWFTVEDTAKTQQEYSMLVEKDQSIKLRDGVSVFGDVFRPANSNNQHPVIFTYGPYCKDEHFSNFDQIIYEKSPIKNDYMVWETPDPETWVKDGYIVVRIDQRGNCKSPGELRILSSNFANDIYDIIEWLGTRPWSNGKVGMLGVSYFAVSQWIAATMNPPHLAAIIPWEGFTDAYRDAARHGGILANTFINGWYYKRILPNQYGKDTLNENTLIKNLEIPHWPKAVAAAKLATDPFWVSSFLPSLPSLKAIQIPVYSSGNWEGFALHGKGNINGFQEIASSHKWLQMHTGNWAKSFYGKEGIEDQKRFFDKFLKGIDNDMLSIPPVKLAIRYGNNDQYTWRYENEWPIARTIWTPLYLKADNGSLNATAQLDTTKVSYGEKTGVARFSSMPFVENTEITGPIMLKLWVSSTTDDIDLFVILKKIDSNEKETTEAHTTNTDRPVTKGWLRVSHRKLDSNRSKPYQPYLSHDEILPLVPEEIVPVEIEVWPTSMVFEAKTKLEVVISGTDDPSTEVFFHNDSADRKSLNVPSIVTIWTGSNYDSHILLPIIPKLTKSS